MFNTPQAQRLRERFSAFDVVFDQCRLGLNYAKPTQLLTNLPLAKELLGGLRCSHGKRAHPPMQGRTSQGEYITKAQSRYPEELCRVFAQCFSPFLSQFAVDVKVEAEPDEPDPAREWVKRRAPTAAKSWDDLGRWHKRFRTTWSRIEHNNIGELRIAVMSLRHLARAAKNWGKRFLLFTDSLVTLGVLSKGRSSSWPLLRLAREAAAYQLVLNLRPYWRYIETDRNLADGPSRGFGLGHAPPWAKDRDRELEEHRRARKQQQQQQQASGSS